MGYTTEFKGRFTRCQWHLPEQALSLGLRCGRAEFLVCYLDEPLLDRVPKRVRDLSLPANFDLAYFKSIEGAIDAKRLPDNKADWPDPALLARMNALLAAGTI